MATTTTSTMVPQWMQDYMSTAAARGLNIADMPFTAYDPTQRIAALNPTQNAAINMIQQRATTGSPLMRQAQGELGKTIGGGYLQGNPYLEAMIGRTNDDVQARMGQLGYGSGSFGNTGVQQTAARTLADSSNALRYQNYGDERGRQMAAIGAAPGMAQSDYWDAQQMLGAGQLQYGQEQAVRDANYQEFSQGREWPFKTQQAFVGSLGMNPGQTSTQQYPDPSKWATALGGAATGAWTAKTIWDLFQ
jgi:hypothetical protein